MADLILLDGATFFLSDVTCDVQATGHEGFFHEDVRHLSRWQLLLDGEPLDLLTARRVDHFSARSVGEVVGKPVTVRRDRFVTDGFHEDLRLENASNDEQRLRVEVRFGADFADVFEAREQTKRRSGRTWTDLGRRSVTLWAERDGHRRGTKITFRRHGTLHREAMRFDVRLRPRGSWSTCIDVVPVVDGSRRAPLLRCGAFGADDEKLPVSSHELLESAPVLETDRDELHHVYRQSLLDLASLRLRPRKDLRWTPPGAGLPWFMTLFGRDSLIASYQALPFGPRLAESTLVTLAGLQAEEFDDLADAEPGKIVHELRRGFLAATGRIPGLYYGTHDATPLFVILLDEYERWTGDAALVRELEPAARAALAWIRGPGDLDGDGYLEYRSRSSSPHALRNHCWKDSDDSIVYDDGRAADSLLAMCELQGYAYDARLRCARLAREVWGDVKLAAELEAEAKRLRRRFERDFWLGAHGRYALALDAEKQPVDGVASNAGHLLWSGIVGSGRAARTARRLLRDDLFTGWGNRTLSADNPSYGPLRYHLGAVWPHDTAIASEGMRRYGLREEAGHVASALLEAAVAFGNTLPELFAGLRRDSTNIPVPYPEALVPQAWAAAAPLLALRTLLGLDVVDGEARTVPCYPRGFEFALRGVSMRGRRIDVP